MSTNTRITKIQSQLANIADDIRYLMNTSEAMTLQSMSQKISLMREQKWCRPGTEPGTETPSDDLGKYFNVWDIEWMENLPSVNYKYFNPIYDGLVESIYFNPVSSVLRDITTLKPNATYSFDEKGNKEEVVEESRIGSIEAEIIIQTVEDINLGGQGVKINCIKINSIDTSKKDYIFIYTIAADSQYTNIIYEKITNKDNNFISFNSFKTGKYYWKVYGINKTNLIKTNDLTGQINFVYQQPPATDICCPIGLQSDPSGDENSEFVIDTNIEAEAYDYSDGYEYWYVASGSQLAWVYFRQDIMSCMPTTPGPPYCYKDQYVSWTRKDGLKMIADRYVRLTSGDCYGGGTYYFEGSNDGSSWITIAEIICTETDYTYQLTQSVAYMYFRIRIGMDEGKLKGIEVD